MGAGWGKFCAKPVYGMESRDLKFFNVNGSAHELQRIDKFCKYAFAKYPGLVFQRFIKGFGNTREAPEVRMYFVGDDYKYSVTHLDRGCYTPSQEGNVGRSWPPAGASCR